MVWSLNIRIASVQSRLLCQLRNVVVREQIEVSLAKVCSEILYALTVPQEHSLFIHESLSAVWVPCNSMKSLRLVV
jgi:hypothetical protein